MCKSNRHPLLPRALRVTTPLLFFGAALSLAGCGNLTAGGLDGEVELTVSGDASAGAGLSASLDRDRAWDIEPGSGTASPGVTTPAAPPRSAQGLAPGAMVSASSDDEPEGEVEVEFLAFLESANGRSIRLSDDEIRVRVDLRGRQEADVVLQKVPALRYEALRLVFTEIEAEVDSGLVVGGKVITGAVDVELEDTTLTVIRAISFRIEDGERVQLLIDLNSDVWLQAVDPDLQKVAEQFFSDAITLVVR